MAVSLVSASRFSGLGRVFAHSGGQQNAVLSFDVYGLCDVGGNPCGPCDVFYGARTAFYSAFGTHLQPPKDCAPHWVSHSGSWFGPGLDLR